MQGRIKDGAFKADFEAVVRNCDDYWRMHKIKY
jgi:hypothetical protein